MTDAPSRALGNVADTAEVAAQVAAIVRLFAPHHDLHRIEQGFAFVERAFRGELDGYCELKTPYHNVIHTNEVVLCSARLLHGLHLAGHVLDAEHLDAALIGALMHDFGYLMRDEETAGSGAQFTATHVRRGVDFAETHLTAWVDLTPALSAAMSKVILVTDHRQHPDWVSFDTPQQKLAAFATATADLIGQMANREYLERLLFLFFEFQEAGIPGFDDIHQLLEKTADFYRITRQRLDADLSSLAVHLRHHFAASGAGDRNFYVESMERNLGYLDRLVREDRSRRLLLLKRGGIVDSALGQLAQQRGQGG